MGAVTKFFSNMNYVYAIELIVILGIIAFLLFVFYKLGLLSKGGS